MLSSRGQTASSGARVAPRQLRARSGPITRRARNQPQPASAPAVEVSVACGWAARAAVHALRAAGADPTEVPFPRASRHGPTPAAGLVYDLSPWDPSAVERVRRHTCTPILLYLPPTGAAFAALAELPHLSDVRLQVQSRDAASLGYLRDAVRDLLRDIPRIQIMARLTESMPHLSSAALLFAHGALRVLGSGQAPSVGGLARTLALSPRTLQRRFTADGLPTPKAFLDWLTLAHVCDVMRARRRSMARAAAAAGLTSNELYRIRKRVARMLAHNGNPLGRVLQSLKGDDQERFVADCSASRTDLTRESRIQGLRRN